MATIPVGGPDLSSITTVAQQPSLTWGIDQKTGRIQGTVDGYRAVRQAVETILFIERFRWQIYSPYSGMQWKGLVGQDPGYVTAELKRRISEALKMDDRVIGLGDFTCSSNGDVLTASLTVQTVYGDVQTAVEVNVF
jgi:hypothetical protein